MRVVRLPDDIEQFLIVNRALSARNAICDRFDFDVVSAATYVFRWHECRRLLGSDWPGDDGEAGAGGEHASE
jgi:hypothetical protein